MSTGKRIPSLDGLRGLAAMMVILDHTTKPYMPLGKLGVDVFFVLSGFLIGGILMDTAGTPGWVKRFYTRRTLRIWPLYFLMAALITLSDGRLHWTHGLSLWPLWTFTVNIGGPLADLHKLSHPAAASYPMVMWILWSVCVEEHAYFLLPPLVRFLQRQQLAIGLGFVALFCVFIRDLCWADFRLDSICNMFTFCRIDTICVGMIAAWILRYRRDWIPKLIPVGLVLMGVALGTVNQTPFWSSPDFDLFGTYTVQALGSAALILGLVDGRLLAMDRLLSLRPLRYLGTVSYGLYVLHPL